MKTHFLALLLFISCGINSTLVGTDAHADTLRYVSIPGVDGPVSVVGQLNNRALLVALMPEDSSKRALFSTDGTIAGTIRLTNTSTNVFRRRGGTAGGRFFFTAHDLAAGAELWATDGTPSGTFRVTDLNPGPLADSSPANFAALGSLIVFSANLPNETALFRSDGTSAGTLRLAALSGTNRLQDGQEVSLFDLNGLKFFPGYTATHGFEIWRTDGTPSGTFMLKDINPNGSGMVYTNPEIFEHLGSACFLAASVNLNLNEVWCSSGSVSGTARIVTAGTLSALGISALAAHNGELLVGTSSAGVLTLWRVSPGAPTPLFQFGASGASFQTIKRLFGRLHIRFSNQSLFALNGQSVAQIPDSYGTALSLLNQSVEIGDEQYLFYQNAEGRYLWRASSFDPGSWDAIPSSSTQDYRSTARLISGTGTTEFERIGDSIIFSGSSFGEAAIGVLTFSPDLCPADRFKEEPGVCGCGSKDEDGNSNRIWDCQEAAIAATVPTQPRWIKVKGGYELQITPPVGGLSELEVTSTRIKGRPRKSITKEVLASSTKFFSNKALRSLRSITIRYRYQFGDGATVKSAYSGSATLKVKKPKR